MNRPEREADHTSTYIAKQYGCVKLQPSRPSACSQYAAYCFIRCLPCNVYCSCTTLPLFTYSQMHKIFNYQITIVSSYTQYIR